MAAVVTDETRRVGRRFGWAVLVAAACSWEAGALHLLEAREHGAWWPAAGAFFVAIGAVQLLSGVALLWRCRVSLVLATLWANVATIAVYVTSRSVGLPGEPPIPLHGAKLRPGTPFLPGRAEAVHWTDYVVLLAEVVIVVALCSQLPQRVRRVVVDALWGLALLGVAASWITALA